MSVLIKNMRIPEDCFSCPLKEEGYCNLTNAYAVFINERNSDCPLVELPEKHGRLIDADELTTDNIVSKIMIFGGQVCYSQSDIDNAPTVIEAEGE